MKIEGIFVAQDGSEGDINFSSFKAVQFLVEKLEKTGAHYEIKITITDI